MPVSDSEAIKFISQNQMDPIVVVKGDGEGGGGGVVVIVLFYITSETPKFCLLLKIYFCD